MTRPKVDDPEQSKRFEQAARELGCDESEEAFDAKLRQVAKHKPKPPNQGKSETREKKPGL